MERGVLGQNRAGVEMSRRLLGYVVKLPDGTRSSLTPTPVMLDDAGDAWDRTPSSTGDYVCPVFAARKPKPAPVVAAEGRYAVLRKTWGGNEFCDLHYGDDTRMTLHVGTRAAVDEAQRKSGRTKSDAEVVRLLADGEHEAAIEAARREERERVAALLVAEADRLDIGCEEAGAYLRAAEIANKGQAK